jgi:UDP-glucose 4-epimerase
MSEQSANSSSLTGRRVIVTGAAGFIGGHLCQSLESRGAHVWRTSRSLGHDVTDPELSDRIVREFKPDSIFHLASTVTGSSDPAYVLPTFRNNLLATVNVLLAAHKHGVRRVLCLGSLHEPTNNHLEFANSPYAAAKFAATAYARMFASLYGLSVTVAIPFMVYGPGQTDTSKVLPHVITKLLQGISPELSSCRQRFDWIHVHDVVEGLIAIHESADLDGKIVDLGTGQLTSVADVISAAARSLHSEQLLRFGVLKDRAGEPVHAANVAETFQLTGWRPTIDLGDGLTDTVSWYRTKHSTTS